MAEQAERAFARTFLNTLSTQPITYEDDYQQPLQYSLKRVPVLPIAVPPPPKRKPQLEASGPSSAALSLVFKSLKPSASFALSVQPTDTIATIKAQLSSTHPSAPPPDAQRLLLKGKALADAKLLKEYNIKDGDTLNLVVKPGFNWDPNAPTPSTSTETMSSDAPPNPFGSAKLDPNAKPSRGRHQRIPSVVLSPSRGRHQRIPSVVLSPSPSSDSPGSVEKDIMLTLDTTDIQSQAVPSETLSTYHQTVSQPEFWERLFTFLKTEFTTEGDAILAFEDFLCATKGSLTASEIAKIRDTTGVVGMAGI
ncbi:hypothetical protein NLJ89_g3191 [Agrocybe chaxingu]|uniref:Ubiquitin-like domain-containing protein n=1 Tax=Agrocybe chaxingu TaxID=84603 RepID=A0A9W8MX29_9AGAR|nr:hypothetical protein NLJ89_g3191 [Agrocybe chaxingu]